MTSDARIRGTKGLGMGGHSNPYRGVTDDWLTPKEIILACGRFDLDPCAAPSPRPWPTAERHIELPDDGLATEWSGRVWLNPPYGPQTGYWMRKLANHADGIALIFARTDTEMFHRYVWERASALLFLEGRLFFHRPDGTRADYNAGAPSVLVAYGERNADTLHVICDLGAFVSLTSQEGRKP